MHTVRWCMCSVGQCASMRMVGRCGMCMAGQFLRMCTVRTVGVSVCVQYDHMGVCVP